MSKSEFVDWKSHPITKQVFSHLREREDMIKETLVISAGQDSTADRFLVGYVSALRDFYLIDMAEGEE